MIPILYPGVYIISSFAPPFFPAKRFDNIISLFAHFAGFFVLEESLKIKLERQNKTRFKIPSNSSIHRVSTEIRKK